MKELINTRNFNEWLYNPNYINPQAYHDQQIRITQEYERDQQKEILNAHKALNDFLDAVQKVDNQHQEQLFMVCFGEIARRNQW